MDFAEISTVFSDQYSYMQQPDEIQTPIETVQQPVSEKKELSCNDYDAHAQYCTGCMYRQAKRRSNIFNIFLIFALFYIVLKK